MRAALAFAAVVVLLLVALGGSYINAHNSANSQEQGIKSAKDASEMTLGQYGQRIREMAQVPGMQAQDLAAIITAANDSRYGGEGVQGVMAWITEQNPALDQSTYTQLQREISAGRTAFEDSQKLLIDRVRAYETSLGSFWTGTWMGIAGFPRIDLARYTIVSTDDAARAFETGRDTAPIDLR